MQLNLCLCMLLRDKHKWKPSPFLKTWILIIYPTLEVHLDEELDAIGCYAGREPVFEVFPARRIVQPNPNYLIFEHRLNERKVYPPEAIIWMSNELEPEDMSFSTPLDLQQLLALMHALNIILPWDHNKPSVTFQ